MLETNPDGTRRCTTCAAGWRAACGGNLACGRATASPLYSPNRWEWPPPTIPLCRTAAVVNPINVMLTLEEAVFSCSTTAAARRRSSPRGEGRGDGGPDPGRAHLAAGHQLLPGGQGDGTLFGDLLTACFCHAADTQACTGRPVNDWLHVRHDRASQGRYAAVPSGQFSATPRRCSRSRARTVDIMLNALPLPHARRNLFSG